MKYPREKRLNIKHYSEKIQNHTLLSYFEGFVRGNKQEKPSVFGRAFRWLEDFYQREDKD